MAPMARRASIPIGKLLFECRNWRSQNIEITTRYTDCPVPVSRCAIQVCPARIPRAAEGPEHGGEPAGGGRGDRQFRLGRVGVADLRAGAGGRRVNAGGLPAHTRRFAESVPVRVLRSSDVFAEPPAGAPRAPAGRTAKGDLARPGRTLYRVAGASRRPAAGAIGNRVEVTLRPSSRR